MTKTIAQIRAALNEALDSKAELYGEDTELTGSQNVEVTDSIAAELDDLNPDHKYPPTNK